LPVRSWIGAVIMDIDIIKVKAAIGLAMDRSLIRQRGFGDYMGLVFRSIGS